MLPKVPQGGPESGAVGGPVLDLVVPVHQEAEVLRTSVLALTSHLREHAPWTWCVTIADNASTDGTGALAAELAAELPGVRALSLPAPGRGGALRAAWTSSTAAVVAYTDVDLSSDLRSLVPLVDAVASGAADLAVGCRLAPASRVVRSWQREVLSRGYNAVLHAVLGVRTRDAQCGFKAVAAPRAAQVLPLVADDGWFFDTELIVLAERAGWRVHEEPVTWVEDPDSRVRLVRTVAGDLRGVARLRWGLSTGRLRLPPSAPPSSCRGLEAQTRTAQTLTAQTEPTQSRA